MMLKGIAFISLLGLLMSLSIGQRSDQFGVLAVVASMFLMAALVLLFIRSSTDLLHPMALLIGAMLLRTGLPALLLIAGEEPQMPAFMADWAVPKWWVPGFHLGAAGCFSVALAFVFTATSHKSSARISRPYKHWQALRHSAIAFTLIGVALVAYYLLTNFGSAAGVLSALNSGILRSADEFARPGTSRYQFLGKQCLLWGSVLWGLTLYRQHHTLRSAIAPPFVAFLLLIPFGGRIVAVAPVAITLLVWWYDKRRIRGFTAVRPGTVAKWAICVMVGLLVFIYIGMLTRAYRSGGGVERLKQQFAERTLSEELLFSIWNETGFLHPLAYAIYFGAGTYEPNPGRLIFGGYSAHLLGFDREPLPGELIVMNLTGVGGWGIHTGATVDLYLWNGLPAVIVGCLIIGMLLKVAYVRLVRKSANPFAVAAYGYLFWAVFWAMFETVIGFPTTVLEGAVALVAILAIATIIRNPARRYHTALVH